jgi:sec-independent protein translocase protein TatC
VTFLAEAGIVTSAALRSRRRYIIVAIAVFAAIATPGGDLVSPTVLGTVMYVLYELTIQLVRRRGH